MALKFIIFDLDDTLYSRDIGLMREVGHRIQVWLYDHLGLTWEEAAVQFESSLEPLEDSGDISCWINASGMLARSEVAQGKNAQAGDRIVRALPSLQRAAMEPFLVGQMLGAAAEALNALGHQAEAGEILSWLLNSEDEHMRIHGVATAEETGLDDLPTAPDRKVGGILRYASEALEFAV